MSEFAQKGQVSQAEACLRRMRAQGLVPDHAVFTTMIHACAQAKRPHTVQKRACGALQLHAPAVELGLWCTLQRNKHYDTRQHPFTLSREPKQGRGRSAAQGETPQLLHFSNRPWKSAPRGASEG